MVNSFSDGKGKLVEPPYGSYVDEWQLPVNSNFGLTDALVSGTTTLDVTTLVPSTPYFTLVFQDFDTSPTPWQNPLAAQNLRIALTGSLSFNVTVYIPSNRPGLWIVDNQTTGAFSVSVKTTNPNSVGIIAPQSSSVIIFCDGTNIIFADSGNNVDPALLVPVGSIQAYAGTTAPAYWLTCDGSAVSRATYSALFSVIGTTWGAGDGSTTFNVPDLRGMFVRGTGTNASYSTAIGPSVGAYQGDAYLNHSHTATSTDSGHSHTNERAQNNQGGYPSLVNSAGPAGAVSTSTGYAQITTTVDLSTTGGTETRPKNMGVLYIIKA